MAPEYEDNGKKFWEDFGKLKARMNGIEQDIADIKNNHLKHISSELSDIKKSINGRPSWPVFWIITTLTAVCVVLLRECFTLFNMIH